MSRLPGAFLLGLLALATTSARGDDPDTAKAKLDKAKAAYQAQLEQLRKGMLASLQKREDAARNDGNKKVVDQVKAEREAFESKGELPRTVPTLAYQRALKSARVAMEAAYKTAIKEHVRAKQDEQAGVVEAELKAFQQETGLNAPRTPVIVATWAHEVRMKGKVVKRATFKMYSNGHINTPDSKATWQVKGNLLILRWPSPQAPGGAWQDVCNLTADGRAYLGKNQEGATLVGVRLSDGAAAKKR